MPWAGELCGAREDGSPSCARIPAPVAGVGGNGDLSGVLQLARTNEVFCALLADGGRVACWGEGGPELRGISVAVPIIPVPVLVEDITAAGTPAGAGTVLTGVQQLVGGLRHMGALLLDRRAVCWGRNLKGQLGSGQFSPVEAPGLVMELVEGGGVVKVPLTDIRQLKVFKFGTCAIVDNPTRGIDSQVRCWGEDIILGNGSMLLSETAVVTGFSDTEPLQGVAYLTGTDEFACAILAQGQTRYCWGKRRP